MTPTGSHAPAARPPALAPLRDVSRERGTQIARHEPAEVSRLDLATLPSAPFWARRQTQASLTAWQLPPETIETATLLVSELVTNATRASSPEQPASDLRRAERISLTLRLEPGRLVIEVSDSNPDPPVLAPADTDAESGRGLMLVQALSTEWGHRYPPAGGKIVFAVVRAPSAATQDDIHHTAMTQGNDPASQV